MVISLVHCLWSASFTCFLIHQSCFFTLVLIWVEFSRVSVSLWSYLAWSTILITGPSQTQKSEHFYAWNISIFCWLYPSSHWKPLKGYLFVFWCRWISYGHWNSHICMVDVYEVHIERFFFFIKKIFGWICYFWIYQQKIIIHINFYCLHFVHWILISYFKYYSQYSTLLFFLFKIYIHPFQMCVFIPLQKTWHYCICLTVCDLCGLCALWLMKRTLLHSSFLLSWVARRTKVVYLLICLSMLQKFCKEAAYLVPSGIFISLDWCFSKSGISQ